jgi:hypothetical protein
MEMTMADLSRDGLLAQVKSVKLDWPDDEDAEQLVDLLCKKFTPQQALTLIFFHCSSIGTTPLLAIQDGRARDVFQFARALVAEAPVRVAA